MKKFKKKGFTLIELIAVLVIMAIIALIVTPLVMSIIRKARISADKRSIDAYGRSIELAIAGYLLDTGKFPTEVSQLTIEYSGNQVVCETTQINTDSSVYLAGCTVAGRNVENYTYGEDKTPPAPTYNSYSVGDQVTYNNINYYVIKDSSVSESTVTLLKAEPLSVDEIATYSAGTGASTDNNGGMEYGETSDYSTSYIKQVVDAWKNAQVPAASEARLITVDELSSFGYEYAEEGTSKYYNKTESTPNWIYNSSYTYWTMSSWDDSESRVWYVNNDGSLYSCDVNGYDGRQIIVRPVIVLPKSAL